MNIKMNQESVVQSVVRYRHFESASSDPVTIGSQDVAGVLTMLLTDIFALYLKTKNVHRNLAGWKFYEYHLVLDHHSTEIFGATNLLGECIQKLGGTMHRWPRIMGHLQRRLDADSLNLTPSHLLAELHEDNRQLAVSMQEAQWLCDKYGDFDSGLVLKECIAEAEQRARTLAHAGQCETILPDTAQEPRRNWQSFAG